MFEVSLSTDYSFGFMSNLSLRWATQRIVFGKPLTSQAVIRAKLASMISRVEGCQNWFESVTYQMNNVSANP